MKYFGLLFLLIIIHGSSCTPKADSSEATSTEEWKALDDYHMIMAESFHPYKDSANLEPAKQYAPELLNLADKWVTEELPKRVDNDNVKELLNELRDGAVEFADLVEVGDDEAIGASLTHMHDVFHHLQEAWYKKDNE